MNDPSQATAELDEMHAQIRAAFDRRDLAGYRDCFSPELTYRQADGRVIDRDQLMKDVGSQFRQLGSFRSSSRREHVEFSGDRATEIMVQSASANCAAFFILHWVWNVNRRARYTWGKRSGCWRVEEVEVLHEGMSRGGFHVGFREIRSPKDGEAS